MDSEQDLIEYEDDYYGDEDSPADIAADEAAAIEAEEHEGEHDDFEESLGGAK